MITFRHKVTGVAKPANCTDAEEARRWLASELAAEQYPGDVSDWIIVPNDRKEKAVDVRATVARETRG